MNTRKGRPHMKSHGILLITCLASLLFLTLPALAAGRVEVALTSFDSDGSEGYANSEGFFSRGGAGGTYYYSFGTEETPPGWRDSEGRGAGGAYGVMAAMTAEQYEAVAAHREDYTFLWARVRIKVSKGIQAGVENFRFKDDLGEQIWITPQFEEVCWDAGRELLAGNEQISLEGTGEYHLQILVKTQGKSDKDIIRLIKKAGLVCDVTTAPGTEKARTQTVAVDVSRVKRKAYNEKGGVVVTAVRAEELTEREDFWDIHEGRWFWPNDANICYICDHYLEYTLFRVHATIQREMDYAVCNINWRLPFYAQREYPLGDNAWSAIVWDSFTDSPCEYDYDMDLREKGDSHREVMFYILICNRLFDASKPEVFLRNLQVEMTFATEAIQGTWYNYIVGPTYAVAVDMSGVELVEAS